MKNLIKHIKNVDFEITFDCNLRCLHCYNETHEVHDELTTDEILEVINQITDLGFQEIHITGGEPLLHPEVIKILEHCNKNRLETLLETNGVLLTKDKLEGIRKLDYIKVRASIDGPEKIHNSIRRSRNKDNPYLISISNLIEAQNMGIPIQITCSVNNINHNYITSMVEDISQRGINDVRLRLSMPSSSGYIHWQILKMDADKLEEVKKQIDYIHSKYTILFDGASIIRLPPNLEQKMFITPHGNVKPYPFIEVYAGNVRTHLLKEILSNYREIAFPSETENLMRDYILGLNLGVKYE